MLMAIGKLVSTLVEGRSFRRKAASMAALLPGPMMYSSWLTNMRSLSRRNVRPARVENLLDEYDYLHSRLCLPLGRYAQAFGPEEAGSDDELWISLVPS